MYATVVPDHDRGILALACHNGAAVVGTRDEMDRWPGTTVLVPDSLGPFVLASELDTPPPLPFEENRAAS